VSRISLTSYSLSSTFTVRSSVFHYEKSHGRTYHAVSGAISCYRSGKPETKSPQYHAGSELGINNYDSADIGRVSATE
jgi:hypothetical protein